MSKDNIQENLIQTGRLIIKEKGVDFLTARKLSEASNYSVGTIYNQFSNMDNFILIQNYMTLDALFQELIKIKETSAYKRLNLYIEKFAEFILENKNFWFMVFNFHLKNSERSFSLTYLRRVSAIITLLENCVKELYPHLKNQKRHLAFEVLWVSLFSLSSLLTTSSLEVYSKLEQKRLCLFFLNTYLTGLKVVEKI